MGKSTGKNKKSVGGKSGDSNVKPGKSGETTSKVYDEDTAVFITMSQELKEEGNKAFQKKDYEGAILKYERALNLLPKSHIDVAHLRSNMASCYMQMGLSEYPRAISECNLALEVSPKYSKALLKRAKCYEALSRLELALRDVGTVLETEPNNIMALEIVERVKEALETKGVKVADYVVKEYIEPSHGSSLNVVKEKRRKKKSNKIEEKKVEDKVVAEENLDIVKEEQASKTVKLIFGEDIRCAQIPEKCSILQVRDIVRNRFPSSKFVLIKYKDQEGDFVTITTTEELRLAEESAEPEGSIRLYITEVDPDQEPTLDEVKNKVEVKELEINRNNVFENGNAGKGEQLESYSCFIDEWVVQFAMLFKNHVGFNSDECLNLHELGTKLFSEAIEDTVTSEEAQDIFEVAEENFQEMTALALFNWGNVHMSRARKRAYFTEDASRESVLAQVKSAYEWTQKEYVKAGKKYEEALKFKPDFYEGYLALGQQQFEQAKLSWYYAIGCKVDLDKWPSTEVLELFNSAEVNMEKGTQIWQEMEEKSLNQLLKRDKIDTQLQKTGLDRLFKGISADKAAEQASNMRSHINLLWGTILYERSIVEFKLGLPVWEECLEVAVEKFELAGASPTDVAVMVKNHCSTGTTLEGLGFKIDEILQAWNEMYDAKRLQRGVPSFRLEPLFRRRAPKLDYILDHL